MPRRCCVTGCRSNYDSAKGDGYFSVFYFPKDERLKEQWLKSIGREDWSPSDNAVVCIKHFSERDIVRSVAYVDKNGNSRTWALDRLKLSTTAVPCVFPSSPELSRGTKQLGNNDEDNRTSRIPRECHQKNPEMCHPGFNKDLTKAANNESSGGPQEGEDSNESSKGRSSAASKSKGPALNEYELTVTEDGLMRLHGLSLTTPIPCDLCPPGTVFDDLDEFDAHMAEHAEAKMFFCQLCCDTYKTWSNLVAHRKMFHMGEVLSCEGCSKQKRYARLEGAVDYPVGGKPHGCEECEIGLNSLKDLCQHYMLHLAPPGSWKETSDTFLKTMERSRGGIGGTPAPFPVPISSAEENLPNTDAGEPGNNNTTDLLCNEEDNQESQSTETIKRVNQESQSKETVKRVNQESQSSETIKRVNQENQAKETVKRVNQESQSRETIKRVNQENQAKETVKRVNQESQSRETINTPVTGKSVPEQYESKRGHKHFCPHCEFSCVTLERYRIHMSKFANSHMCTICTKTQLKNLTNFDHEYCKSQTLQFSCIVCMLSWDSEEIFISHLKKFHADDGPILPCCMCGCKYDWSKYVGHVKRCRNKYREWELRRNMVRKTCQLCWKYFQQPGQLMRHMKLHRTSRTASLDCATCHRSFRRRGAFSKHLSANPTHGPVEMQAKPTNFKPKFACEHCGLTYSKQESLRVHLLHHSGLKRFQCPSCSKAFFSQTALVAHMRQHSGAECLYVCEICGMTFCTLTAFHIHQRSHQLNGMTEEAKRSNVGQKHKFPISGKASSSKLVYKGHIRKQSNG